MLWKDIKLATLQKMFSADGSTIPTDSSTTDYLAGMPYVANEALNRLSTVGKFITKSVVIAHNPLDNLLSDDVALKIHKVDSDNTLVVKAKGVHSFTFEFSGKIDLKIGSGTPILYTSKGKYTEHKGLVENDTNAEITITISADYPSTVKNIALYKETFDTSSEVPEYATKVRYNLTDIATDFYQLGDSQIYYEGGERAEYLKLSNYYRESDKILVLDRDMPGSYTVYYRAYPAEITVDTEDTYDLPLDREVAVLLPLYMASQLYKDDDNGIATTYRNEFEVGLESLIDSSVSTGYEKFTSESGWI